MVTINVGGSGFECSGSSSYIYFDSNCTKPNATGFGVWIEMISMVI